LFIGICLTPAVAHETEKSQSTSRGNWLYVGGDGPGNYTKIQDAINHANDGDTVFVFNGTYVEYIIINRSITLIGQDKTTTFITGYVAFTISLLSDQITMSGFTIQNNGLRGEGVRIDSNNNTFFNNIVDTPQDEIRVSGNNNTLSDNAIACDRIFLSGDSTTISGNTITNNNYGLFFVDSWGNTILDNSFFHSGLFYLDDTVWNNIVTNNTVNGKPLVYLFDKKDRVLDSPAGQILLINCTNITVINQDLSNTTVGIQALRSDLCVLSGNILTGNIFGILLNGSGNAILENSITNNSGAITLSGASNVISRNIVSHNGGSIYLVSSDDNYILHNTVSDNFDGMVLDNGCDFNTIVNNTVVDNNFSGLIVFHGDGNIVSRNTLSNNKENRVLGNDNTISDNTFTYGDEGVSLGGNNNTLSNNTIRHNVDGIKLIHSDYTRISKNFISNNHESMVLLSSDHNSIDENIINNNDIGIHLVFCNEGNVVTGNTITMNNQSGIYLNCTNNSSISNNSISHNGQGICLISSPDNTILENTFLKNTRHALFENCTNTWDHNYWGRPRILPKIIFGIRIRPNPWSLPMLDIDWHPAFKPGIDTLSLLPRSTT
jgi:parallel beta-helix repeat protein